MYWEFIVGYVSFRLLELFVQTLLAKRRATKGQAESGASVEDTAKQGLLISARTALPGQTEVLGPLASELVEDLDQRIANAIANGFNAVLVTDVPVEGYKYGWYTFNREEGYALHGPIKQVLTWLEQQGHDTFIFWRYGDSRDFYYPWTPWPGGNNLRILITFTKKSRRGQRSKN